MTFLTASLLIGVAAALAPRALSPEEEIRRQIERFIQAYNAGDVASLMAVYAPDFVDMSEGERTLAGEEAHRVTTERLVSAFARYRGELTVTTEEVVVSGDLAYDRGVLHVRLSPRDGGPEKRIDRRFLEIWKRQEDGRWLVSRAMDNGPV